ncbi:MAG: fructose-1,6-bisphosphatase [Eubacteriales bacterium]|nr:fructose-1,6-bisphosphatase [Eubacteriales bacterium]
MRDLDYLKLLSKEFPNRRACVSEIINLNAILGLPKGTEYFFSDIHGEDKAFIHLLRSSSGIIRTKITEQFGKVLSDEEQQELAKLIYYPERYISRKKKEHGYCDWQKISIYRLIKICKLVSSKYTRSKVRKKMPKEYAYILEELLQEDGSQEDKQVYYSNIIDTIVNQDAGASFIIELCDLIHNMTIDSLHIIGDIFDRGPHADLVIDELMKYNDVDIQWGNHDIDWMGAACGNEACICNVLRIATSYNNFDVLEDGYGINLRALSIFAERVYGNDPCTRFMPHLLDENEYDEVDPWLVAKMHKAITIIQFKVEAELIKAHPEYEMEDRLLLDKIDFERGVVEIEGKECKMMDTNFPTIYPGDPYKLTDGERQLLDTLRLSFTHSQLLKKHIQFLYSNGSIYKTVNNNLLYHGCIPMNEDGSFMSFPRVNGKYYQGKALMDYFNKSIIDAYYLDNNSPQKKNAVDLMWYLWCGLKSPVFGKAKMTVFEHYFTDDKELVKEPMNPYYKINNNVEIVDKILEEFGLNVDKGHIINGHVPVKRKDGEKPYKAGGKLFVIDGGLAKSYHAKTGIAGYTLIYNSQSIALAAHAPFIEGEESTPMVEIVQQMNPRARVSDTDIGDKLKRQISDMEELLKAYREGQIEER